MDNNSYVYIMTNEWNSTLYIGVTKDLFNRVNQHKSEIFEGFTKKYHLHKLVYFEQYGDLNLAIAREKQLKGGSRKRKVDLINQMNPSWKDLFEEFMEV